MSDNGPQFTAQEFEDFCSSNGIKHIRVTPYHPSSNGLAERAVIVVKEGLKKQQKQNHDKHLKGREFQIGDHVYVKNPSSGHRDGMTKSMQTR